MDGKENINMSASGKIALRIFLMTGSYFSFTASWNGAFHFMLPKQIAAYSSPDGNDSLVLEQMGDPKWSFGAADVKDRNSKIIGRISAWLQADGANADKTNIASGTRNGDAVIVVLCASEMQDEAISIP